MANLILNVEIGDVDVTKAAAGFLKKVPMNQIKDPDFVQPDPENPVPIPLIDEFPSTRLHVENFLRNYVLRVVNEGIDLLAKETGVRLTKDIFVLERKMDYKISEQAFNGVLAVLGKLPYAQVAPLFTELSKCEPIKEEPDASGKDGS